MIRYIRAPLVWLLFCAVPASATNLLANPDFDTDVSAWNYSAGTDLLPSWDGTNGSPATGSARLDVSATPSASSDMFQCVNIAGGQSIDLSIRGKGDTCGNTAGGLSVYLSTFNQPNCAGYIAATRALPSDTISGWNVYTLIGYALAPSVQSVIVSPKIDYGAFTTSTAYFDHAELSLHDGATPIPGVINADFDHGLCGWTNGSATYWDNSVGSPTPGSAGFGGLSSGVNSMQGGCLDIANQNIDAVVRSLGDDAAKQAVGSYFVGVVLNIYDQPGCAGTNLGYAQTSDTVTPRYGWNLHSLTDYVLPAGAQSVGYALNTYPNPLSVPQVNMDHVYVGPHRIFADSFE